jgi:hypothetical protein
MSYDLFFRSRNADTPFSRDDFARHFSGRPRFEVKDSQAWYANEDSGVYFAFDYVERAGDPDPADDTDPTLLPVSFNLNYFRPHPFGLEAEPEVGAFVRAFDLTVSDPQLSGMGDGEYSTEGFLSGWNAGNAFGFEALASQDLSGSLLTMPAARIHAAWQWNFNREARQNATGDAVFVPRIFFFDVGGEVQTGVAWGDGIPILLPVVDVVLVPRQRLAPRRWLRSKDDLVVFSWPEIEPIASRFQKAAGELESFELFYDATPADIEQVIRDRQPAALPTAVTFDKVLDRELLKQATK